MKRNFFSPKFPFSIPLRLQNKNQSGWEREKSALFRLQWIPLLAEIIILGTENTPGRQLVKTECDREVEGKNTWPQELKMTKLNKYIKQFVLAAEKCFCLNFFFPTVMCCKPSWQSSQELRIEVLIIIFLGGCIIVWRSYIFKLAGWKENVSITV